jgi:hypothetical protein
MQGGLHRAFQFSAEELTEVSVEAINRFDPVRKPCPGPPDRSQNAFVELQRW